MLERVASDAGYTRSALEGTTIALAGRAPHDELLAARAAAGVLGLDPRLADAPERAEVGP